MKPDDRIRIRHIVEAMDSIVAFSTGRRREDLVTDTMLRFALERAIGIVGEAAGKIDPETHACLPDIPWPAMIAMRNRLVHAYFDVNHDILWTTVTVSVPDLLASIRRNVDLDEA